MDLKQPFSDRWPDLRMWCSQLSGRLAEFAILVLVVFALEVGFLFLCDSLWAVYAETQVGHVWIAENQSLARLIAHVLDQDKLELTMTVLILTLRHLLTIGVVCQLILLLRFFYLSQGPLNRVLFWGIPLSVLNGLVLNQSLQAGLPASVVLAAFPTLALMHHSLMLSSNYIHEVDEICIPLVNLVRRAYQRITGRNSDEGENYNAADMGHDLCTEPDPPSVIKLEDDPRRPGITRAACGRCSQQLTYPSKYSGRKVKCRNCETAFVLP